MSTYTDLLATQPQPPDRLYFATGILLDAQDFQAEQLFHRGRLARTLAYLHGYGTVAGLRVEWSAAVAPDANNPDGKEEQLLVQPGLAIDRLGRLIEVPRSACIRLDRWYKSQEASDLAAGFHAAPTDGVIVDLFIRFVACERGKTPAFAAGPFDALDAVQPSRLRDGYELELVIRKEAEPKLPLDPWATIDPNAAPEAKISALHETIYSAWQEGSDDWDLDGPVPQQEHALGQDTTALFLARLILPAAEGTPPTRTDGVAVTVSDASRRFVYPTSALAKVVGVGE
ncbi:MAG: hypothetical protein U0175_25660 [Caldilineaceae bacterium]